ncbi:MAG: electron transfer flavoprotein subunit beta/FixA family protein [Deltaproteobacteria bacterium]|nr:electron transfer flavoprotein subunit beta/FixA family protein [Deltaproteobacteria bacterium]
MKIFVLIKQVPDTAIALEIKADAADIMYQDIPWVINPYDEYAVEEALCIKEKLGGSVTVISMGPDRVADIIRSSFAMGADEAVHLKDTAFNSLDAYSTAFILSKAISISGYDIILCGKQAVDDGWGYIGPALAEILSVPSVSSILKLKISEDKKHATATREIDEGLEVVEVPLPALFAVQQGINKPRYASLPGIMKAKKKEIKIVDAGALGVASAATDLRVWGASRTNVKKLFYPPERKKGKVLEGDSMTVIKELINLLRNEAKVI